MIDLRFPCVLLFLLLLTVAEASLPAANDRFYGGPRDRLQPGDY